MCQNVQTVVSNHGEQDETLQLDRLPNAALESSLYLNRRCTTSDEDDDLMSVSVTEWLSFDFKMHTKLL